MRIRRLRVGLGQREIFDVTDARHEFDTEQVGEPEYREILRLCIAMHGIRPDIRAVLDEAIEDVDRLIRAARYEATEQCDVFVGHVVVADATVTTVTDVIFGQDVLLVHAPFGAVGRGRPTRAPIAGQQVAHPQDAQHPHHRPRHAVSPSIPVPHRAQRHAEVFGARLAAQQAAVAQFPELLGRHIPDPNTPTSRPHRHLHNFA